MSYTVLARKYRSQSFAQVIGQQPIAQTLQNAIKTDRVAHAFLFVGTRGVGKTTMARILAKALNCHAFEQPTAQPCCKCESCIAINAGEDVDVIEIDGASNNKVEEARMIRENAIYRPARSRYKIYIIDEVHMLSNSAFNALLKILEEPPSHVKFIFATTEPNKVIATVQSRCQRFDFRNIGPHDICDHLKMILAEEKIKYEDDVVVSIAKMANGSMRDGLSLLDRLISSGQGKLTTNLLQDFLGCPNSEKISALIDNIGDRNPQGTLSAIQELIDSGLTEVQIIDAVVDHIRDILVAKSAGIDSDMLMLTQEQKDITARLAEKFDIAGLVYSITTLEKMRWSIRNSDTARALLDAMMLRFALKEHFLNVDQLINTLQSGKKPNIKKNEIADTRSAVPGKVKTSKPSAAKLSSGTVPSKSTNPAKSPPVNAKNESNQTAHRFQNSTAESLNADWHSIIEHVAANLGNATAGILGSGSIDYFDGKLLRLSFPEAARWGIKLCRTNGRADKIQKILSDCLGNNIKIEYIHQEQNNNPQESDTQNNSATSSAQKRKAIMNDPAVKSVLMGFEATVTGFDDQ
jgi:DNA polymerase-3 subunit gamma/tau